MFNTPDCELQISSGHIVDHLNTVVAGALWKKLSEEDRKIFTDVAQEAAAKATAEIKTNEAKLVDFFKQKGLTVTEVNKDEFRDTVLKTTTFESSPRCATKMRFGDSANTPELPPNAKPGCANGLCQPRTIS